jgi:hypothetical protein
MASRARSGDLTYCHPGQAGTVHPKSQLGGYRTSVLSRPSQCVTVIVVTGQSAGSR